MKEIRSKLPFLFVYGGFSVFILIYSIHFFLKNIGFTDEASDSLVYVGLLSSTGGLLLFSYTNCICNLRNRISIFWASQVFFLLLVYSVSTITVFPGSETRYWFGYGQNIAIISILIIPILIILFYRECPKIHLFLTFFTCGLVILFYLPSILQAPWGVIDWGHTQYVLNEILAPQNGSFPLINFSAQYTSIGGYLFNLIFFSKGNIDQAVWFLTMLSIVTISLALLPIIFAFPKSKGYLAVLFIIPAVFIVKQNEDSYSGSLAVLFSAIPIRTIFPAMLALVISINYNSQKLTFYALFISIICSLAILNNFESGIVSTIATIVVFILSSTFKVWLRQVLMLLIGVSIFLLITKFLFQIFYGDFKFYALIDFVGGFSSGFGSHPMPDFGLWLFAFVFLALSVVVSALFLRTAISASCIPIDPKLRRAAILALFWGLFGIGMAPYYINRSIVSGQLQFILFPVFLSAAGLFLIVTSQFRARAALTSMVVIIATLPAAISVASLTQHPSLNLAWERLKRTDSPVSKVYTSQVSEMQKIIQTINQDHPGARIGLLSNFGSIFSSFLNIPSYLPVNNAADLRIVRRPLLSGMFQQLDHDQNEFIISIDIDKENIEAIEANNYELYMSSSQFNVYVKK